MASIIKYRKVIADNTTYQLIEPDYAPGAAQCTELCTIAGETYVSVPASVTLPPQPKQLTIQTVTLTLALRDQIKAASPHVRLINERVVEKIREKYSLNDEIKMTWKDPTLPDVQAYRTYVATCVAEGQSQKAALGL